MRALLDEQVPVDLAELITASDPAHEVDTVTGMGWNGFKNGRLLSEMRAAGFAALVTIDRRMEYQQNIAQSGIGLVVLHTYRARLRELAPLAPAIAAALGTVHPGQIIHLHAPPPS